MEYKWEAWVHPENGGSDVLIEGTTTLTGGIENADKDLKKVNTAIRRLLKRRGSIVLNDYRIISFS